MGPRRNKLCNLTTITGGDARRAARNAAAHRLWPAKLCNLFLHGSYALASAYLSFRRNLNITAAMRDIDVFCQIKDPLMRRPSSRTHLIRFHLQKQTQLPQPGVFRNVGPFHRMLLLSLLDSELVLDIVGGARMGRIYF